MRFLHFPQPGFRPLQGCAMIIRMRQIQSPDHFNICHRGTTRRRGFHAIVVLNLCFVVTINQISEVHALTLPNSTVQLPAPRKSGRQLTEALAMTTSWSGVGVNLKSQLMQFSQQTELVIVKDRRVDPEQTSTVEVKSAPRAEVLFQLAEATQNGGWCLTDDFVYFGSRESAGRLPVLLAASRQLMSDLRNTAAAERTDIADHDLRRMTLSTAARWERLAEPRQILVQAAREAGISISNPDEIPHDLWEGAELRPMTFFELSTLILNQFDLKLVADGILAVKVVSLDEKITVKHAYEIGRERREQIASSLQQRFPELAIMVRGSVAQVSGSLNDHAAVQQYLLRQQFADKATAFKESLTTRPFTLRAERATVGQLIAHFRSENIRIEISDESSAPVQSALGSVADVSGLKDKLPGSKFFPQLFGKYFRSVDVQSDRVVLSNE